MCFVVKQYLTTAEQTKTKKADKALYWAGSCREVKVVPSIEVFGVEKKSGWLIKQFEAYRFNGTSIEDKFIPRPYISIIFHFKDCAAIVGETTLTLEPFFAAPIVSQAFLLKFQGNMDTLAVTCRATVFSRLFNLDMSPTPHRSISLPRPAFQTLWETMAALDKTIDRINCFVDFTSSLHKNDYHPDAVDLLYDKIIEKSITTPLKEIMEECGASKSTLLRKFVKRTGVNPKTLARVVRVGYLWAKIRDDNAINYQDLVFYGNYFDQPHLIRDFKAILGETPGFFFCRNLEVVRKFSGKPGSETQH